MTDDEIAIAEARARDEEIARVRAETREASARLGLNLDWSEETVRAMVLKYGQRLASEADEEAARWAEDRFTMRRSRIERAKVRLEDDEVVGVASLLFEPLDEPPVDDLHARRIKAMAAIRARHAPKLPPFVETPALAAVRATLRDRAARKLTQPFVVLYGMIGVSKTSAGAHAIASVNGSGYVDARALCDLHGSFAREDRATVTRLYDSSVLVVDGLEAPLFASRGLGAVISDVIDARRGARRVTIMTTNEKPRAIADALTEQGRSRAAGLVKWVKCVGEDLRKKRRGI